MKTKTLFLIAFICLSSYSLFSQEKGRIIYTDFEPDTVVQGYALNTFPRHISTENQRDSLLYFEMDINYDDLWDFKLYAEHDSKRYLWVNLNRNTDWRFRLCIATDPEDLSQLEYNGSYYHPNNIIYSTMLGYEPNVEEKKVALRHSTPNGFCYGWISFSVTSGHPIVPQDATLVTITIHDMAYCTIPNYPLMFGQKDFMDIEENEYATANASLFPNPVEDRLSLQLSGNASCKNVEIYGIDGRLLKSQNDDFENIDVSALPTGLYIAKINLNDGTVFTEKVVVK